MGDPSEILRQSARESGWSESIMKRGRSETEASKNDPSECS